MRIATAKWAGSQLPPHYDPSDFPSIRIDFHPGRARLVAAIQNPAIGVASQGSATLTKFQVQALTFLFVPSGSELDDCLCWGHAQHLNDAATIAKCPGPCLTCRAGSSSVSGRDPAMRHTWVVFYLLAVADCYRKSGGISKTHQSRGRICSVQQQPVLTTIALVTWRASFRPLQSGALRSGLRAIFADIYSCAWFQTA